ncbi:hypothetical protein HRG_010890 [Hirsutella rhossiliensis]|uniref:DUF7703 domain-containing protein n=1 Tax=Hirsutella rhossiliensis TaxID=111463 RepID=A0A9P8MN49_9HYPO|nr:uncharacterized protein HRG_10890 [Hirsutella rhossiliensis]KAH0958195.1 hypothetical protein HRG_10890 [Hirsutella rhossiliensis]
MIITNAIRLDISVIVLVYGSNSNKLEPFVTPYSIFEKLQLSAFTVQKLIISGLYIIETTKILQLLKGVAPAGPRRVMSHLIIVNFFIVLLDVSVLAWEFTKQYNIQTAWKPVVYSVKLKVEFTVLNRLQAQRQGVQDQWSLGSRKKSSSSCFTPLTFPGPITMLWLTANMSHFVNVDLLATATNAQYLPNLLGGAVKPAISFLSYSPDFYDVMGHNGTARMVWDLPWEAFHEAGVYNKEDSSLNITSNYRSPGNSINITVVSLDSDDYG